MRKFIRWTDHEIFKGIFVIRTFLSEKIARIGRLFRGCTGRGGFIFPGQNGQTQWKAQNLEKGIAELPGIVFLNDLFLELGMDVYHDLPVFVERGSIQDIQTL